ncbi:FtsX-like permease family protein [Corynebacterium sputi]|uniref:FtsX-like permease family protein n=1 Tax=Corynebacterium sputi TaxID=489915 RepID=UPI0003FC0643|nr:ABC transporter permease [Corynebacterium sputi]
MYHGLKELRAAPGRTALITVTIGLITVMVAFLSALMAGLSHQSVSGLDHVLQENDDPAIVLSDSGTGTLSASQLELAQVSELDGEELYVGRVRVADTPAVTLASAEVAPGEVALPPALLPDVSDSTITLGPLDLTVTGEGEDLWLDHQPVLLVSPSDAEEISGSVVNAVLVDAGSADLAAEVSGTTVLTGQDRFNASASYQGEQTSLGAMTTLLYLISALVVGAFFAVWTVQRTRSVAISTALGASRSTLIADALSQAVVVLVAGIAGGLALVVTAGAFLPESMPAVFDLSTTLWPGLLLGLCGLVGAAVSLRPVLTADPRTALANA